MTPDTFLPVNEAAQAALPVIFAEGKTFLRSYRGTVRKRAGAVTRVLAQAFWLSFVKPEGGGYAPVRMDKKGAEEEKAALGLLRNEGLLVHPGYFYDMEGSHFVISFVTPANVLNPALQKIVSYFA